MKPKFAIITLLLALLLSSLACQAITELTSTTTPVPSPTVAPTPLPAQPVKPGVDHPDEPVFISGEIPFTSPFFLDTLSEAFVMLEDQGGFIQRDLEFEFRLEGQTIGPVEQIDDETLAYQLSLPAIPQGTPFDLDNDGVEEAGVQVFAVAYWSNTWDGPFLEERDGTGWSTAYASTITDVDRDYEITGGVLIVWSPDDEQSFPTGFGPDNKLFTDDDPAAPIPAGYNIIYLDEQPFRVTKEAQPTIDLIEGATAVTDYTELDYTQAFEQLFEQASTEYPFTEDKNVPWQTLYDQYAPRVAEAQNDTDFFWALKDFSLEIPDGHIGVSFNDMVAQIFYENYGGSFGMILVELSDGRVLVQEIFPDTPAERAGLEAGTEITHWQGQPIGAAIEAVEPFFGPYSTGHHRRLEQLVFLTRVPPRDKVTITVADDDGVSEEITLQAEVDYDSLFEWIPSLRVDELSPPLVGEILEPSGLGYIRINTFSDDYNLSAQLWNHYLDRLTKAEVPGLILDLRVNGGGSMGLANNFAGYFFQEETLISKHFYYNHHLEEFEEKEPPTRIEPGPSYFDAPIAVLVSPYCVSACEGFSYALSQRENSTIVGHFPTAGAYGEVGRGQYDLPADLSMQFPTGRPETPAGELLIEGTGVIPDISVSVTEESALGQVDTVLEAAVEALP